MAKSLKTLSCYINGAPITINEVDFDPEVHTLQPPTKKATSAASEAAASSGADEQGSAAAKPKSRKRQ